MTKLFLILIFCSISAFSQENGHAARTMPVDGGICTNCSDTVEDTLNPVNILPPEAEKQYNDFLIQSENGGHISISDFLSCIVLPVLLTAAGLFAVHALNK